MIFRTLIILMLVMSLSCSQSDEKIKNDTESQSGQNKEQAEPVNSTEIKKGSKTSQKKNGFPKSFSGELKTKPEHGLAKEEIEQGWLSLFDGQTLFGWRATSNANWSVNKGVIHADKGEPGFLMTPFYLKNYIFRCEYRLDEKGNSGIFLRTPMNPEDPSKDCYEFNLCDSHEKFPTGSLVGRKKVDFKAGSADQWRTVWIKIEGNNIQAKINGRDVLKFEDSSGLEAGHLGLQMNGGKIEFKNIAIRPLGEKKIFNNRDLSGWNIVPGSKSQFSVKEELLHLENGAGFLETEKEWANFLLFTQIRTNGDNLNGGIFFRAMKGTEKTPSNGYELQIHNGFANNDRRQPNDYKTGFGTGAIFRRAKARWVVPNDKEWFCMTLIAQGPSFYSWVNGLQVVDFTDTRKMDENPRRGQRLKAGHFSLQGHDETTDVDFKTISIISFDD